MVTDSKAERLLLAMQADSVTQALCFIEKHADLGNYTAVIEEHFLRLAAARDLDPLTGLPRTPADHPVCAFLDLVNFRQCNRDLGHLTGDRVLKEFAIALIGCFPQRVYRVGGDEFLIGGQSADSLNATLTELLPVSPWPYVFAIGANLEDADSRLRKRKSLP